MRDTEDKLSEKLMKTPDGECAFCHGEGWNWLFIYSLEDYAATNLDEEPPVRLVPVCAHHHDEMNANSELVDKQEVPGLAQ